MNFPPITVWSIAPTSMHLFAIPTLRLGVLGATLAFVFQLGSRGTIASMRRWSLAHLLDCELWRVAGTWGFFVILTLPSFLWVKVPFWKVCDSKHWWLPMRCAHSNYIKKKEFSIQKALCVDVWSSEQWLFLKLLKGIHYSGVLQEILFFDFPHCYVFLTVHSIIPTILMNIC
jgi:hypothetical protein